MYERSGPFWDAVAGRAPMPRAARTLGLEFIAADIEAGTIELGFTATWPSWKPRWRTPTGP
jgi:hypothetical protein